MPLISEPIIKNCILVYIVFDVDCFQLKSAPKLEYVFPRSGENCFYFCISCLYWQVSVQTEITSEFCA